MSRRLVIFDCDGTLVDSQHVIVAAMNLAFDGAGHALPAREAILGVVGLSLPEAIGRLTGGADDETVSQIREGYSNAFTVLRQDPAHHEPLYEGALDSVLALAACPDTVLGIATGKSQAGVRRLLEKFDLKHCFETIQTADDAPSKPHPGMILSALEETGVDAANAVMIGDTSFDMEMARNAGVAGLGVSWGYHPVEILHASGAGATVDDYAHLMRILETEHAARAPAQ